MPNPLSDPFWAAENVALRAAIAEIAADVMLAAAGNAIAMLPAGAQILVDWTLINQDVMAYLNGRYLTDVIPVINGTTRRVLRPIIQDWINSGEPLAALEKRLVPLFGSVRAAALSVTEVTRLYSAGNMLAWGSTGMVAGKRWYTVRDSLVCPLCGPLHGQIVELSAEYVQTAEQIANSSQLQRIVGNDPTRLLARANTLLRGAGAGVIGPPRHTRCRCYLLPVLSEELIREQIAGALASGFFAKVGRPELLNALIREGR